MITYIDESGNFQPQAGRPCCASVVGALVVPEEVSDDLLQRYSRLRSGLGFADAEIKGSSLDEGQIAQVVDFLDEFPVIFEACAMEMAHHSETDIDQYKKMQCAKILEPVDRTFGPNLAHDLFLLSSNLGSLSSQLFAQSTVHARVVEHVIRLSTILYSQVLPRELGSFRWYVDSKRDYRYANLSSFVVLPTLEYRFSLDPLLMIKSGDYSHYARFAVPGPGEPAHDLNAIWLEGLSVEDSRPASGLELIDILTNALRRAYRGRLQREGWDRLGRLMLFKPHLEDAVQFLRISPRRQADQWHPTYAAVQARLNELASGSMIS